LTVADILPFPSRAKPRPADDDGTVMFAARNLMAAGERFEHTRAKVDAEAERWEAGRRAAQEAYFARKAMERGDGPDAA
jgi:hypothetical protein